MALRVLGKLFSSEHPSAQMVKSLTSLAVKWSGVGVMLNTMLTKQTLTKFQVFKTLKFLLDKCSACSFCAWVFQRFKSAAEESSLWIHFHVFDIRCFYESSREKYGAEKNSACGTVNYSKFICKSFLSDAWYVHVNEAAESEMVQCLHNTTLCLIERTVRVLHLSRRGAVFLQLWRNTELVSLRCVDYGFMLSFRHVLILEDWDWCIYGMKLMLWQWYSCKQSHILSLKIKIGFCRVVIGQVFNWSW